jgi:alpha-galactosidase
MSLKIAMIGAGSIGFTRRLMHDLLAVPEFADSTFALMDIDPMNLDMVTQVCRRDVQADQLPARIISTLDRREAVKDANYVICTIRQGRKELIGRSRNVLRCGRKSKDYSRPTCNCTAEKWM